MDRTISSLSNPSPPNSISTSSSSWSPTYSSSSRAKKIGAFLLAVSVVRVRSEMNYTNYAKNVQSEYSQNKIQISKVQQNVQKVELRFDEKKFFIKSRCKSFFDQTYIRYSVAHRQAEGVYISVKGYFPCIKD